MFGAVKAWMILGGGCRWRLPWRLPFIALRCKRQVSRCSRRWVILQSRIHIQKHFFYVYPWTIYFSTHEMIIMTCFYVYKNLKKCFWVCIRDCKITHLRLHLDNGILQRKAMNSRHHDRRRRQPPPRIIQALPVPNAFSPH